MGNTLTKNPIYVDTAATAWSGTKWVRLIQWIDDAADIADDDDLSITINGLTMAMKIQIPTTTGATPVEDLTPGPSGLCVWQVGPFNPGMPMTGLIVNTIDHGALHIWVD